MGSLRTLGGKGRGSSGRSGDLERNFVLLRLVLKHKNAAHAFNDGEKSNEERKNLKATGRGLINTR